MLGDPVKRTPFSKQVDKKRASFSGALCFAELGLLVPRSGAEYVYFQEAFGSLHKFWGPLPSFLCSWVYVVVLRPAEVAVIIMAFAQYVCQPFEIYIAGIEAESMDLAKKFIAVLALGKCPHIWRVRVRYLGFSKRCYGGLKSFVTSRHAAAGTEPARAKP